MQSLTVHTEGVWWSVMTVNMLNNKNRGEKHKLDFYCTNFQKIILYYKYFY